MKVVFLTSCLEPGRDGVGDYCHRLSNEMGESGHDILLISLNDPWSKNDGCRSSKNVSVLRLSSSDSLVRRSKAALGLMRDFRPDWVSLQYVCYGYHPRGLAWRWNSFFAKAGNVGNQRHLMLHELWIGPPPIHRRLIGWTQKLIIQDLHRRFRPDVVTTSTTSFQDRLVKTGINAGVVPLFGNVPVVPRDDGHVANLLRAADSQLVQTPRGDFVNGVFFGTIHPDFDITPLTNWLKNLQLQSAKPILISVIGRNGGSAERLADRIIKSVPAVIEVVILGEQPAATISQVLQYADFGINTGSPALLGKSGTFAAMREHGLPVILSDGPLDSVYLENKGAPVRQFSSDDSLQVVTNHPRLSHPESVIAERFANVFQV